MKIDWKSPREREDLNIPDSYLAKDAEMQNRRELTFILQEAAFSENIPLYCTIDIDLLEEEERRLFGCDEFEAHAALLLGMPINEMLLLMEQDVPECGGMHTDSMAELWVRNRMLEFSERLAVQGYKTKAILPAVVPDPEFAAMLAASKKGFAGRNGRFVTPDCGCRVCIGLLLTDAPLMGGDYRYADYNGRGCGDCRLCIDACPAGAFEACGYESCGLGSCDPGSSDSERCDPESCDSGSCEHESCDPGRDPHALVNVRFNREKCIAFRDCRENQEQVAEHSRLKCMRCMEVCPIGQNK